MIDIICNPAFERIFNDLFYGTYGQPQQNETEFFPTISEIPISRVVYSKDTTVVYFTDGTKTTVKCSSKDTYDRQTAIAYALVKRIFGKIGRYDEKTNKYYANEIDGNGLGSKLEKIAAFGFDQDKEEAEAKAKKAAAKAEHEAKQKAEHEAAWKRRVEKRAEELRLEREANALLDSQGSLKKTKTVLNENTKTIDTGKLDNSTGLHDGCLQIDPADAWKLYRRPDKPFSQFTDQEKKAYWSYHNHKRRANKKA